MFEVKKNQNEPRTISFILILNIRAKSGERRGRGKDESVRLERKRKRKPGETPQWGGFTREEIKSRAFAQKKPLCWAGRRRDKKGTRVQEDKTGPRLACGPRNPNGVGSCLMTGWSCEGPRKNEGLCIPEYNDSTVQYGSLVFECSNTKCPSPLSNSLYNAITYKYCDSARASHIWQKARNQASQI